MNKRTFGVSENGFRTSILSMSAGKPFSASFEYDPSQANNVDFAPANGFKGEQASSFSQKRKIDNYKSQHV